MLRGVCGFSSGFRPDLAASGERIGHWKGLVSRLRSRADTAHEGVNLTCSQVFLGTSQQVARFFSWHTKLCEQGVRAINRAARITLAGHVFLAAGLGGMAVADDWQPMGGGFSQQTVYAVPPAGNWASMTGFDERQLPGQVARPRGQFVLRAGASQTARLLDLIAHAEAGRAGYDAVHLSARIAPPARPSRLTLTQIFDWIEETPGQHHAIGRYQFIPATLARLVRDAGVDRDAVFSPALQDKLAGRLFVEAGYTDFLSGQLSRSAFMDELAKVWAGLPLASGLSAYDKYAGNRATVTRADYARHIASIFGSLGAGA